jgi:hypothetical protein
MNFEKLKLQYIDEVPFTFTTQKPYRDPIRNPSHLKNKIPEKNLQEIDHDAV